MGKKQHPQSDYQKQAGYTRQEQSIDPALSTPHGFGSIIDSLPIGVIVFDTELNIVFANAQACGMVEPYGSASKAIWQATHKADIEQWEQTLLSVCKDGKNAFFNEVQIHRAGKDILADIECTVLRDVKTGLVNGGVMTLRDVTEKVEIQRKLSHAERLAAVGKLAGKIAHELNNPLDGIVRYINLTLRTLDDEKDEKAIEYLKQSRYGLMRMANIISEMLEFSRSGHLMLRTSKTVNIVEEAIKAIAPIADGVKINVTKKCPKAAEHIADANLFQVYCNLIKNAVDAMEGSGNLNITIDSDKQMSIVSFTDTGLGFDPEIADDIFKPFFTTKHHSKGTGLGLAICKDIVEKYNGKIIAENTGTGSRFSVCIPL